MVRLLYLASISLQTLTGLAAAISLYLIVSMFRSMMDGGEPEAISMVFAIGITAVPYCLAGAVHRMAQSEDAIRGDGGKQPE